MAQKVREVMTADPATVDGSAPATEAATLMRERAVRRVPVVEDGAAVGIVSIGDLAIERDRESALADITAAPANR
jgi:CBS domain-containing protein